MDVSQDSKACRLAKGQDPDQAHQDQDQSEKTGQQKDYHQRRLGISGTGARAKAKRDCPARCELSGYSLCPTRCDTVGCGMIYDLFSICYNLVHLKVKAAAAAEAVNLLQGRAHTCSFLCGSVSKLQRSTRKRWAVVPPVFAMIAFLLACTRREGALTRTEASGRKSTLFSLFSRTYNTITRFVSAFSRAEGAVRGFKGS